MIQVKYKPMLATNMEDLPDGALEYPKLISPKLDGIRAMVQNGVLVSRNMKPIANKFIRDILSDKKLEGLDGELIVGVANDENVYRETSSGVMSEDGNPSFTFHVFDKYHETMSFLERLDWATKIVKEYNSPYVKIVPHHLIKSEAAMLKQEEKFLKAGYEGAMLRDPYGIYKQGRATAKSQMLLKVKRFSDSEAEILSYEALTSNLNELERDALGRAKRSSAKAGLVEREMLGTLNVRDVKTGVEFRLGSGFTHEERIAFWKNPKKFSKQLVKYKFFSVGAYDKPRFPTFLGYRTAADLD